MNILDKKIIMFEGCDRTGKSTFINYLNDELKIHGYHPYVLHLMGPTKFQELTFSNDDKSLIQLSKFNDEYDIVREMIQCDDKARFIFDRTSFGEYIWTRYWNRTGKYTDYVISEKFIERHRDLMNDSLYIEFYMSDINELEKRISSSEEDLKIFTINEKTVKENVQYVYDLYSELEKIVKNNHIDYLKIDSSQFKRPEDDGVFIGDMLKN